MFDVRLTPYEQSECCYGRLANGYIGIYYDDGADVAFAWEEPLENVESLVEVLVDASNDDPPIPQCVCKRLLSHLDYLIDVADRRGM